MWSDWLESDRIPSSLGKFLLKKEKLCLQGELNPRLAGINNQHCNQLSQVTIAKFSHIIIFIIYFSASRHLMPFDDQRVSDLYYHYDTHLDTQRQQQHNDGDDDSKDNEEEADDNDMGLEMQTHLCLEPRYFILFYFYTILIFLTARLHVGQPQP